jgi:heptosyltransferase II
MFDAKRILVIRYRFLGDTILTVPFLRNLRRAQPNAKIDVLVGPVSGQVLLGCPYVDEFIEFDTTRFHKYDRGSGKKKSYFSYLFEIRKRKYDAVFVLKRSLSSAFLAFASGASVRAGYATEGRSMLLTHRVPWNTDIHEVDSVLNVLESVGIPAVDKHLEAWISEEETASMLDKVKDLHSHKHRMLIHAAAAHPDKTYPLPLWAEVIKALHNEFGTTPFFSGDRADRETYEELERLSGVKSVNMAGELTVRESMALYKEMDLAVCVDSGPAHLACATGIPTVTLFGPTDPNRWRPLGPLTQAVYDETLECRPCHYKKTCDDRRQCLTELAPAKIIEASRQFLLNRRSAIS